jgi:excinuclease ABC subunit B
MSNDQKKDLIEELTDQMHQAAKDLEFEKAAHLRDEIQRMKKMLK